MIERIHGYLEQAVQPMPPDRILREVLNIYSPNAATADKVLSGIIGNDPRFRRSAAGLWQISQAAPRLKQDRMRSVATLFIQSTEDPSTRKIIRGAVHVPEIGITREFSFAGSATSAQCHELRRVCVHMQERTLVVWSANDLVLWNRLLRSHKLTGCQGETFYLGQLARRMLSRSPLRLHPEDLASHLGLPTPEVELPRSMARFLADTLDQLLETVPPEFRASMVGIQRWMAAQEKSVDLSQYAFGREFLRGIPESPGIYLMRSRNGDIIYVGKARNLKRRINSYFTRRALKDARVAKLHRLLHSLEFVTADSEVEALLLEMRMIHDFQPPLNLQTEVHEQLSSYGRPHNLVILVGDKEGEKAQVYFLQQGSFVGQQSVSLGGKIPQKLRERIRSIYFSSSNRKKARTAWEREIVGRWFAANRRRLNYVEVDEAGDYESVLERLGHYLRDPQKLSQKVYYR